MEYVYIRLYPDFGYGKPRRETKTEVMEGTANFANVITYPTTGKTTDIRCRMQQRLTLLLTCSIATRRRALARFLVFCSLVNARFFGFLIGISISTPSRVKPRKPRSCRSELPCGKGLGTLGREGIFSSAICHRR